MKKYLLVLPIVMGLIAAAGPGAAQVWGKRTGVGFSDYGTYRVLNVGPVANADSKRAGNGRTGSSDVPVYSAKRGGLKLRRLTQRDASGIAITLDATGGMAMKGVPVFAGDMVGSLRIVRYDKHVFGVVDGLRDPLGGSFMTDDELGRAFTAQVQQRTGCALNGPPLLQFLPARLGKMSVPLACR